MMERNARKFVFFGRSGIDREPARLLVEDLKERGATVEVSRVDASDEPSVFQAFDQINGEIGGVFQAAMGLHVSKAMNL